MGTGCKKVMLKDTIQMSLIMTAHLTLILISGGHMSKGRKS